MSPKSVSLSVRLSPNDAASLAELKISGAATPSDKIRALIGFAAKHSDQERSYGDYLSVNKDHLNEKVKALLQSEDAEAVHSELIGYFGNWLTESTSYFLSATPDPDRLSNRQQLIDLEHGVADRIFLLFEHTLRLAVTGESPCYDKKVVIDRSKTVADLAQLLSAHISKREDNNG